MVLSAEMRLSEFFREFYVPQVMIEPNQEAMNGYEFALKRWAEFTQDPPIRAITSNMLSEFKAYLATVTIRGGALMAANTRRKYLDHIQWILDQCGPTMAIRRLRNAAGIIERVPYTKPPNRETKLRQPTSKDLVVGLYEVADKAILPKVDGITPGAWWRGLLTTICCTTLRVGQLIRVPMSAVNWDPARPELRLQSGICRKSRCDETKPLHPVAFKHLLAIRGDRELLFPAWPEPYCKKTVYDEFHRLEVLAGFTPSEGVAFHGIRRMSLTELAQISSTAAQMAAGHQSFQTTLNHYIGMDALRSAVGQLSIFAKFAQ